MTLLGWIVTLLFNIFLGGIIAIAVSFLIEKAYIEDEDENEEVAEDAEDAASKENKKESEKKKLEKIQDITCFIILIVVTVSLTFFTYNSEKKENYNKIEIFKVNYSIYTSSLKDEKLYGEVRYELINDIKEYNIDVLYFQSLGRDLIGQEDLKSKIAALKLIEMDSK